jgi:hypothetical protein
MITPRILQVLVAGMAVTLLLPSAGNAKPAKSGGGVAVCSKYGKGCITGAVRRGRFDNEVRLPGGTWIGCKLDCKETLREESVDFFETLRERSGDNRR